MRQILTCSSTLLLLALIFGFNDLPAQPYPVRTQPLPGITLAATKSGEHTVHYAYSGDVNRPGLLFIHGTPGSWQAFGEYLGDARLQQDYFMVSVDRLGWGNSSQSGGEQKAEHASMLGFTQQAESLAAVMQQFPDKRWLVVGHSLGASIAPKLAMMMPDRVSGLLLLAGSLSPSLGRARWYNLAASLLLIKWMLPQNLRYSNDEIMALHRELKVLEAELADVSLNTEVVVMQGMKDRLVAPGNARYAAEEWESTFSRLRVIELPDAGHFLPWQNAPLVVKTIREFGFND